MLKENNGGEDRKGGWIRGELGREGKGTVYEKKGQRGVLGTRDQNGIV